MNVDSSFQLMSANVKSILANANLTETEGKVILDNLGVAAELFPFFKDRLSSGFSLGNEAEESDTEEMDETQSSKSCNVKSRRHLRNKFEFSLLSSNFVNLLDMQFLKDSSKLLCGKTLIQDQGQIYRIISSLTDSNKAFDQKELESLPGKIYMKINPQNGC